VYVESSASEQAQLHLNMDEGSQVQVYQFLACSSHLFTDPFFMMLEKVSAE
jgi:hypothetical protein